MWIKLQGKERYVQASQIVSIEHNDSGYVVARTTASAGVETLAGPIAAEEWLHLRWLLFTEIRCSGASGAYIWRFGFIDMDRLMEDVKRETAKSQAMKDAIVNINPAPFSAFMPEKEESKL